MTKNKELAVSVEQIARSIVVLRGQKVLLDSELATLYGVTTKRFNEQVRRNLHRFPADFMFQVTEEEHAILRSHFATSSSGHGGRRYLPYVFTEHGAIMAATILNTPLAVEVSVYVVRAFVRLRAVISANKEIARKLEQLERKMESHDHKLTTHDEAIAAVLSAIRELMAPPEPPKKRRIGFIQDD
jgi:hypothetical protein